VAAWAAAGNRPLTTLAHDLVLTWGGSGAGVVVSSWATPATVNS
jgi:hypothetical protein